MSDADNLKNFAINSSILKIVVGESIIGTVAAATVAPAIAMVDKCIFCSASGREPMMTCLKREAQLFVTKPITFLRQPSFVWILAGQ